MCKKLLLFLLVLFFTGCASKSIVFYNSEPMPYSYHTICPGGDISITVRYVTYKKIIEGKEVVFWPTYNELEKPLKYDESIISAEYQVRLANPKRRKIQIRCSNQKGQEDASILIYEGRLPLRSYNFQIETNSKQQQMWIELLNQEDQITCVTPRAIWIRQKQNKNTKENSK